MAKRTKKTVWHKRRGKMIPAKYARVHHGAPPTPGLKKDVPEKETPTQRFMRHVAEVAKKAAREQL